MKFKFMPLDEEFSDIDNDFDDSLEINNSELVVNTPDNGIDNCVSSMIISSITQAMDMVNSYNSMIQTLNAESANNEDYSTFIDVIKNICAEENKHVGQLQELLTKISPNAKNIDIGRDESKQQFEFNSEGKLNVSSWDEQKVNCPEEVNNSDMSEYCSLSDVDDEM